MSEGKIAPYRRSILAGEGHTGSLLLDQHRSAHKHEADAKKQRGEPTATSDSEHIDHYELHI